jgi:hypothetical protein
VNAAARLMREIVALALAHPQGPQVTRAYDCTLQFELTDGEPFYLEAKGGAVAVREGESGLDWQYRDWERALCVRTSHRVLRDAALGRYPLSEALFDDELAFAPYQLSVRLAPWLYALFRLAHEQVQRTAAEGYLADLVARSEDGGG